MRRQRAQRLQIIFIAGVNRIVGDARGNEIVVGRIVLASGFSIPGAGCLSIHSDFTQAWPMLPGFVAAGHARKRAGHGTAIAAGKKLPLAQGEKRQLVDADEKKFRALILVDVVFALAVAEARGRAVPPGDDVLRFVETCCRARAERRGGNSAAAIARARETCGAAAACSRRDGRAPGGSPPSAALSICPGRRRRRRGDTSPAIREIPAASGTARSRARPCSTRIERAFSD